jgi:hypothetical protein
LAAADFVAKAAGLYADGPGFFGGLFGLAKRAVSNMSADVAVMLAGMALFGWARYGDRIKAAVGARSSAGPRRRNGTVGQAERHEPTAEGASKEKQELDKWCQELTELTEGSLFPLMKSVEDQIKILSSSWERGDKKSTFIDNYLYIDI